MRRAAQRSLAHYEVNLVRAVRGLVTVSPLSITINIRNNAFVAGIKTVTTL